MPDSCPHIVLVEDDSSLRCSYEAALTDSGYRVTATGNETQALPHLARGTALLVLSLGASAANGSDVLKTLQEKRINMPMIVITSGRSPAVAVSAMRAGAGELLVKPLSPERLLKAVRSELAKHPMATMPPDLAGLPRDTNEDCPEDFGPGLARSVGGAYGFIGFSATMQRVYAQIEAAARSNATVFITGESGTGKEVCAEAVHKLSPRAGKPFVPINCAAIPRDLMESELFGHAKGAFTGAISDRDGAAKLADGGTLFLDEVAEMNPDMQTKLLRFLQDLTFRKVGGSRIEKTDVRIICATNRTPADEIKAGRFREDLFYRLHVLPITMPPLRRRDEDILDIAHAVLMQYSAEENKVFDSFSEGVVKALRRYRWPGNIRQLQNVIRHIVVMNDARMVEVGMLPPELLHDFTQEPGIATGAVTPSGPTQIRPLAEIEREAITQALALFGGNVPQAAAALKISPSTIYRKKAGWPVGDDFSLESAGKSHY